MNVTELARKLKISTSDLRDWLPKLGFSVGQKAIKIDDKLAQEIITNWRSLMYNWQKKEDYKKEKEQKEEKIAVAKDLNISLPKIITVRELAAQLSLPVNKVLAQLMQNGIMVSLNERLDYDTSAIIAADLGYNVSLKKEGLTEDQDYEQKLKDVLTQEKEISTPRDPVVVILGHVDHGKTKLLDTIRKTHVVEGEAGGITQHIGAYQAKNKDKKITFIDTPGHEAFTAMRSRGAKVADIAVLIVAADDGVMPQTVEALKIIQNAKLPVIVAINKIDKPTANIEKVKTELARYNLIPENWGGNTTMVPVSALTGKGIDELMDMILLTADMHKETIVANLNRQALGTIIESHVDKGEGNVATILIQTGTLHVGDHLAINNVYYGKIRAMRDYTGKAVEKGLPSMPVRISGLKLCPQVGDLAEVVDTDKVKVLAKIKPYKSAKIEETQTKNTAKEYKQTFNIVLRADVLGSLEAIMESLEKIETENIKLDILAKGLGNLTENDLAMAEGSNAMVVGFNVQTSNAIAQLAAEKNIEILEFNIIYKLIETLTKRMEESLGYDLIKKDLAKIKVLAIFKTEKEAMILGGKVIEGKAEFSPDKFMVKVNVVRKGEFVSEGILDQLQSGKQNVNSVESGQECGIRFIGKPLVLIDDILELFTEQKKKRSL